MNNIDVLWTTDPGWAVIGIFILAFVLLIGAYMTKFNWVVVILDVIVWIVFLITLGGVLGFITLPDFLNFFNVITTTATE